MKKKLEVSIRCKDEEVFNTYFAPNRNKIVCNVFDNFWGPCEVADSMIKRFLDTGDNNKKTDFICVDKCFTGEAFAKFKFGSQPKFFVIHVTFF